MSGDGRELILHSHQIGSHSEYTKLVAPEAREAYLVAEVESPSSERLRRDETGTSLEIPSPNHNLSTNTTQIDDSIS